MAFIKPDQVVPGSPIDIEAGRVRFFMLGNMTDRYHFLMEWAAKARAALVEYSRQRHYRRDQAEAFAAGYAEGAVWLAHLAELDDLQAETFVSAVQQGLILGMDMQHLETE